MVRQLTEAEVRRWRPAGLVIFSVVLAVLGHSGWLRGQTEDAAKTTPEKPLTAPTQADPSAPQDSQPAAPPLPESDPAAPEEPDAAAAPAEQSSPAEAAPAPQAAGEPHHFSSIVITPRQKYPPHSPYAVPAAGGGYVTAAGQGTACDCEVPGSCPQCRPQIHTADYRRAYDAIPFSRAEYEANPSYRHEAAMELLFGQLRPTTIHRVQPAVPPRSSALSSAPQLLQPAPFRHYRFGYYRHGYGVYYRWNRP